MNPITTKEFKMNGINNTGLYKIGNPKIAGSLMLNKPGTNDALATALICLDLDFNPIMQSGNVLPEPPRIVKHPYKNTGLNTKG